MSVEENVMLMILDDIHHILFTLTLHPQVHTMCNVMTVLRHKVSLSTQLRVNIEMI